MAPTLWRMDDSLVLTGLTMKRREGFPDQRLIVLPRPQVVEALGEPVTRRLLVTDAGNYPAAPDHEVLRPRPIDETIVIVCTMGTGWVTVGGVTHRLGAGSAVVIPAGEPHSYGAGGVHPWTIWWCHLAGTDVAELVGTLDVSRDRPVVAVQHIERAVALLDEIVSSLERDLSPIRLIGASGAAWKLLTQMSVDRVLPGSGDPLQRAMAHLADRLDGAVSVPQLAAMVGVSPSHLGALFRRATGGGVLAHHAALRMARARHLLDTTDLPIAEIGREVGYRDALYFSRQFRRVHGASPTAFRERA